MDNSIIYEAVPAQGVSVPFIVLVLVFMLLLIYGIFACIKQPKTKLIAKIFFFFADAILLLCIITVVIDSIDSEDKVWDQYVKGNYFVAEGAIENYEQVKGISETDIKYDSFTVSEVEFHAPGFVTVWGYPLRQADGGILGNGMKVRISYIPYKFENVIMKIEVQDSKKEEP